MSGKQKVVFPGGDPEYQPGLGDFRLHIGGDIQG